MYVFLHAHRAKNAYTCFNATTVSLYTAKISIIIFKQEGGRVTHCSSKTEVGRLDTAM